MTTEQILRLDGTYNEDNKNTIQKVLRQIKPLSRYSEEERVPIEALEKMVTTITTKYAIQPQWITCTYYGDLAKQYGHYSCGVKTSDTHAWLGTVSTSSLYELLSKLVIFMYAQVKSGSIILRADIVKKSKEVVENEDE
jgi:hypothetical protein